METMTNNIILSTTYFGPIEYFVQFITGSNILIEKHENYQKQSFRNRCEIYGANGKLTLSVPIEKKHNKKVCIKDVHISYDTDWIKLHLKSIESAYRSAPFFEYYIDDLFALINSRPKNLFEFNTDIIKTILEILEIDTNLEFTSTYEKEIGVIDLRNQIHPKVSVDKSSMNFLPKPYYQVFEEKHGFIPNLSVLDLIFNTGPEARQVLINSRIA